MTLDVIGLHSTATRRDAHVSLVKSISSFIKTHISTHILILNPFILVARLYLPLPFSYVDFLRLSFSTFIFRRDSEAPPEAGKSSQGNNEDDRCRWCMVFRWVSAFPFRFGSSSIILISFLVLPLRYHHKWQYSFKAVPNRSAEAPVISTLPSGWARQP